MFSFSSGARTSVLPLGHNTTTFTRIDCSREIVTATFKIASSFSIRPPDCDFFLALSPRLANFDSSGSWKPRGALGAEIQFAETSLQAFSPLSPPYSPPLERAYIHVILSSMFGDLWPESLCSLYVFKRKVKHQTEYLNEITHVFGSAICALFI